MKLTNRSPIGFTLIELLMVLAIMAILAACFCPALAIAKFRAKTNQCPSNFIQLQSCWVAWAPDIIFADLSSGGTNGELNFVC